MKGGGVFAKFLIPRTTPSGSSPPNILQCLVKGGINNILLGTEGRMQKFKTLAQPLFRNFVGGSFFFFLLLPFKVEIFLVVTPCDMGNFHRRYSLGAAQVLCYSPVHCAYPLIVSYLEPYPCSKFHVLITLWLKEFLLMSSLSFTSLILYTPVTPLVRGPRP